MKHLLTSKHLAAMIVALGLCVVATNASALDSAYSRKGPFGGVGLGGGAALVSDDVAGDLGLSLQVGVGANEKMTVALNLDTRLQIGNEMVMGTIVPGPRVTFFLNKNFYIQSGIGLAFGISSEPEDKNVIGLNIGANVGYEYFANTNLAAYFSAGAEYYLLNAADDLITFGIALGIRYY